MKQKLFFYLLLSVGYFLNVFGQNTITFDGIGTNAQDLNTFTLTNSGVQFTFSSASEAPGYQYRTGHMGSCYPSSISFIESTGGTITKLTIARTDGNEFTLEGFTFVNDFGCFDLPETLVITGFKNMVSTGSTNFTPASSLDTLYVVDISSDSKFQDVDVVEITFLDGSAFVGGLDNVIWSAAAASNTPPTFTALASDVEDTDEDTAVEITFAEIAAQGNEADVDGTVDAFVVQSVSTGTLMIGGSAFASGTNDEITASKSASWTPALNANGTLDAFTITAKDDGDDESTGPVQATVSVTAVNDEPSFTKGANEVVNEDAGAQTVNGWATNLEDGDADAVQTLTFTVVNNNNSLFSTQPAINSSGNLTYTSAIGVSGVATVSIVLTDDGGTANGGDDTFETQMFTITVNSVNDEPSFTKGANETVTEDAGAQEVNGWATSIDDGDGDTQVLTFNVTNDNNALFSVQPDIDESTGNLTYTPAANAFGSAEVTVSISDNGGTANGGDDTSADQTFTITVTQVNDTPVVVTGISDDTGASDSDYITSDTILTVTGTAEPNSLVTFTVNGTPISFLVASAVTNAAGEFSYTAPGALGEGTATFIATSTLNGVSLNSSSQQATIDTMSPTVTVSTTSTDPTNDDPIPVTITFSQEVSGFTSTDISVTNGTVTDFSTIDNTIFTFNLEPTGTSVSVSVASMVATDLAGNGNEVSNTLSLTYDGVAPVDPVVTLPTNTLTIDADNITISGSHSEEGVIIYVYEDSNNDGEADSTTALDSDVVNSGNWSISVNLTQNAVNNFVVQAEDGVGNTSSYVDVPTVTEDGSLSVQDVTTVEDLISIVNPVRETLEVFGNISILSVSTFDLTGALVANSVDVSSLTPGVYVAVVETSEGTVTKKIIKE